MDFRIKIQNKAYEIKSIKVGEARALKTHFGMSDFTNLGLGDPDVIAGFAYLCFQREDPRMSHADLMDKVDGLDMSEDFAQPDPEPEPDPTPKAKPRAKKASGD